MEITFYNVLVDLAKI